MKIAVCFKVLPDPDRILPEDWDGFTPSRDLGYAGLSFGCFDEAALELALRLGEQAGNASCTAVTVCETLPDSFAARLYAAGFHSVLAIPRKIREFVPETVGKLLAAAVSDADIVLFGREVGMAESGAVPYYAARELGIPVVSDVEDAGWQDGLRVRSRDSRGLWEKKLHTPVALTVGNSPAVLRAATLRMQMKFRGRSAEILPSDLPEPEFLLPEFCRPGTGRKCTMLDPEAEETCRFVRKMMESAGEDRTVSENRVRPEVPGLTVLPDTARGRERAVRLQKERKIPCFFGGTPVRWDKTSVTVEKSCCGGNLLRRRTLPLPAVWTDPEDPGVPGAGILVEPAGGLGGASRVVVCGNGAGSKLCGRVRSFAGKAGWGFGLTRPAVMNGWGSVGELLGQSGLRIRPRCILVLGAAGAGAFLQGISGAGTVIAVNHDPHALIFRHADYGICMDAAEFFRRFACEKEESGWNGIQ